MSNAEPGKLRRFSCALYLLVLLFAACCVLLAAQSGALEDTMLRRAQPVALDAGWRASTDEGDMPVLAASREAAGRDTGALVLSRALDAALPGGASLCFQTKNESVRVYVDGALQYAYGDTPQRVFGHGLGALWHIAPLPADAAGRELTVELTPVGGRTGREPYTFMLGNRGDLMSWLMRRSLAKLLVVVLLALTGLGAAALSLCSALRRGGRALEYLWFSLFVLLSAVWLATDSGLTQFVMRNKGVSYMLFGCSFYLLGAPFSLFIAATMKQNRALFYWLASLGAAYAAARVALFALGVMDFELGLWILHAYMALLIVATNVALWLPMLRERRFTNRWFSCAVTGFTLIESAALVSFYAGDKLNMQRNGYSSGFYLGILFFVIVTVMDAGVKARRMRQKAFQAAFFERRAYTDELTGLMNVKGFDDKCEALLRAAPDGRRFAVVDFDVNYFSQYNANNGLDAGDELLRHIADELRARCLPGELSARQEADHFVCLVSGASLEDVLARVEAVNRDVHDRMTQKMLLISYGVAEVSDRTQSAISLRNQAVVAKRTVKGNYETNVAVYDKSLHETQLRDMEILSGFEKSLERNEYIIFLQPKIDLAGERLAGAEALVRRIEPDGSILSAGPIIGALERKGFVAKLDYYILDRACAFLRRCLDAGLRVCPVSSNFSRVHIYDPHFATRVAEAADRNGVPHELVEVELTETAFLAGKAMMQSAVRKLHDLNFRVSIDDFGSGYSSLNMLKDVEADTIKLDREFIDDFEINPRAGVVVKHAVKLAQEMGIETVAEGIETEHQLTFLRSLGCDIVQGYYYSRPLPEDVFVERYLQNMLTKQRAGSAQRDPRRRRPPKEGEARPAAGDPPKEGEARRRPQAKPPTTGNRTPPEEHPPPALPATIAQRRSKPPAK